jgi:hypothetical protein
MTRSRARAASDQRPAAHGRLDRGTRAGGGADALRIELSDDHRAARIAL